MEIKATKVNRIFNLNCPTPDIVAAYLVAKSIIIKAGYGAEITWQASRRFDSISETDFLREYAWVALSAGMHESVIRGCFPDISKCFYNWQSANIIVKKGASCRNHALAFFNNRRKIDGILHTAQIVDTYGFVKFKEQIQRDPLVMLQSLPFIGPVTTYHLAKNIGLPFAKPDRHLVRLANLMGYKDVQEFCRTISVQVNDSIPVVDIVLWRFAAITNNTYLSFFHYIAFKEVQPSPRFHADRSPSFFLSDLSFIGNHNAAMSKSLV